MFVMTVSTIRCKSPGTPCGFQKDRCESEKPNRAPPLSWVGWVLKQQHKEANKNRRRVGLRHCCWRRGTKVCFFLYTHTSHPKNSVKEASVGRLSRHDLILKGFVAVKKFGWTTIWIFPWLPLWFQQEPVDCETDSSFKLETTIAIPEQQYTNQEYSQSKNVL